MAKFCGKCGAKLSNGYCIKCGRQYLEPHTPYLLLKYKEDIIKKIMIHIIFNCVIWLCIGAWQIHTYHYIVGIWNIIVCLYGIFSSYNIKSNTNLFIQKWNGNIICILVFCIINLLIGSIVGFILNLHMLYIRHIINKNKIILWSNY